MSDNRDDHNSSRTTSTTPLFSPRFGFGSDQGLPTFPVSDGRDAAGASSPFRAVDFSSVQRRLPLGSVCDANPVPPRVHRFCPFCGNRLQPPGSPCAVCANNNNNNNNNNNDNMRSAETAAGVGVMFSPPPAPTFKPGGDKDLAGFRKRLHEIKTEAERKRLQRYTQIMNGCDHGQPDPNVTEHGYQFYRCRTKKDGLYYKRVDDDDGAEVLVYRQRSFLVGENGKTVTVDGKRTKRNEEGPLIEVPYPTDQNLIEAMLEVLDSSRCTEYKEFKGQLYSRYHIFRESKGIIQELWKGNNEVKKRLKEIRRQKQESVKPATTQQSISLSPGAFFSPNGTFIINQNNYHGGPPPPPTA